MQQAWQAFEQGVYQRTIHLVDSLEQQGVRAAALYFLKGRVYLELNHFDAAIQALEQAKAIDPNYPGIDYQLGHAAFLQGRYREALTHYRQALEQVERISAGNSRQTGQDIREPIYRQIGRTYFLLDSLQAARRFYEKALALDSTQSETYRWLSEVAEVEGQLEDARRYAEKALALDPGHFENLYRFATLLLRTGYPRDAVYFLQEAFRRNPHHRGVNYNLGRALMLLGERKAAQFYLERARQLEEVTSKLEDAKMAAYQYPRNPRRWAELAALYVQTGDYLEARKALDAALFLDPDNLALQNDRANLALLLGDTLDAVRRYYQLLQRDSTLADVWLNLGVVLAAQQQYDAARRAWLQALRYRPNDDTLRRYLAELERRRGS